MSRPPEEDLQATRSWTPPGSVDEPAADPAKAGKRPVVEQLGPYRIEGQLGRGGMGVVYVGLDSRLDRRVAIKMLPEDVSHDGPALSYLENEARVLASLNHPNIATIYSLENVDGLRFFTLELIHGETLATLIPARAASPGKTLHIFRQIAEGLAFAHENSVIHCDLKPANIVVGPRETAKILDFGLARALRSAPGAEPQTRTLSGTPGYMSPEQIERRVPDEKTDSWAFGCLLAEALTGHKMFTGDSMEQVFTATRTRAPDLSGLPDNLPRPVRDLIVQCLEKDHARRLGSVAPAVEILDGAAMSLRWLESDDAMSGVLARTLGPGDGAVPFELQATDGALVRSNELLRKGPLVICFYRGRWCPVCTAELAYFQQRLADFVSLGASVVAISPQMGAHNEGLKQEQELAYDLLSDPGNQVAKAYGVAFGLPEDLRRFHRSLGLDLKAFNGDDSWVLPIPATFVVRPDGKIHYAVTSPDPTVRPNLDRALEALRKLRA